GRPARDEAGGGDHVLGPQPVGGGVGLGGGVGMEHELDDSRPFPQVDEDETAVVAAAVHPARDPGLSAGPPGIEMAGPGVTEGVGSRTVLHRHTSRLPRRMVATTVWGS